MIAIIDYDAGNTKSVKNALDYLKIKNILSKDPQILLKADGLILPGVGAFKKAMDILYQRNLISVLKRAAYVKKPILGICLGMQLFFEESFEFGKNKGLGLIPGRVLAIPEKRGIKIPHMGWDFNHVCKRASLSEVFLNQATYFAHSYYVQTVPNYILSTVDYGLKIPSIVQKENVFGMQFHPEKSGEVGLKGLLRFKEVAKHESYTRS